ncbi:Cthe_2314 family HEPN domain-containing protein [Lysinibacillus fusiformis]|uniref:Cthe_2314 family HEPN domain-containing protein n=1 Tax=Lysinibacillus fusiformis TaxID=28031 RepID=UPI00215A207C|nr:Cthe_2314 family HEPN domain-containing protein [Lysinibacillus fusiformis]MCR8853502.1 Cthe_2314 family HEPN domain-containing protein [Lysinibacillus fusiformis]
MTIDIADYLTVPEKSEWKSNIGGLSKVFDCLFFEQEDHISFDILKRDADREIEINHLKDEFNNRILDLLSNYVLVKHFYNKGIPDEEWYRKENGKFIFYPNFQPEHFGYQHWFNFYIESLYSRFIGLIDSLFHIVNIKYKIDAETKPGFRRVVLNTLLQIEENDVYKVMNDINNSKVIRKLNIIRNNFIHNQKPSEISSGVKRFKVGGIKTKVGLGDYTTSTELLNVFQDSIKYLKTDFEKFKLITKI